MLACVIAYVGLGANLGDASNTVKAALAALNTIRLTEVRQVSSLYQTAPMDADGDDYINAVAEVHTGLNPEQLLTELQNLEQQFGRLRPYQNAPRTLDCDLLLYGQQVINTPTLQVPHPRMHVRAFVLVPLLEIAGQIHIPQLGSAQLLQSGLIGQLVTKLPD
jgi:2-amino-4-hydroxy-6-hydroxymethyldihydropteridine diphosphokinase